MEQYKPLKFAKRFNELRGEMSQEDFAEFVGISRPTVGFYENEKRLPQADILKQIADRCGVSSDWLLGITDFRKQDAYRYNLEDMHFTEKAANFLDRLSTAASIAEHVEDPSAQILQMSNAYRLLIKILESPKFFEFLCNAVAYVEANPSRWSSEATFTLSNGKEFGAPVSFAKDLFWSHCTAPLKECVDNIESVDIVSAGSVQDSGMAAEEAK